MGAKPVQRVFLAIDLIKLRHSQKQGTVASSSVGEAGDMHKSVRSKHGFGLLLGRVGASRP